MGGPSYDRATLDSYFHALRPAMWDDPVVGPVLRRLAIDDPDVIAAVVDVDRSLIEHSLSMPPLERFRRAVSAAASIERTRSAAVAANG